jgi:tetratricopeptide (TPR) repeat protein
MKASLTSCARRCSGSWGLLVAAGLGCAPALPASPPYRPISDDTVLVRLPRGLAAVRSEAQATDLPTCLQQAEELIRAARREGDPRLLARAQAVLRPWWDSQSAPVEVCLLRAHIRQGLHEFTGAQADLDDLLSRDPRNVNGWLLKTTLHQVRGEYRAARQACLQLGRFADELTATTAAVSLAGLGQTGEDAAARLAKVIDRNEGASVEVRAWAWTTLGEVQARFGHSLAAENSLRQALRLQPTAAYPLAALADLLLDRGRFNEVIDLLGETTVDTLRLRLAEASYRLRPDSPRATRLIRELDQVFVLARERGDQRHLREEARFVLHLRGDATAAADLARRNWDIQKEPADLRILLEATRAAGDWRAHATARDWASKQQPASLAALDLAAACPLVR